MRFDSNTDLFLYSTPLDENYKNVYDNYPDRETYHAFLLGFSHIIVSPVNVKSSRDNNGRFYVDIANFSSMQLHDVNYLEFRTNGVWKFAFITSIQSQNDGLSSSSCQLYCKLDAWANHYLYLSNKEYPTIRSTIDLNAVGNKDLYSLDIKAKAYRPVSCNFLSKLLYTKGNDFSDDIRVLWLRAGISPSHGGQVARDLVEGVPNWVSTSHTYGCYNCEEGIVLMPIAIVKGNSLVKQCHISIANNNQQVMYTGYTADLGMITLWLSGNYLTEASLTYFPSFEYTISKYTYQDGKPQYIISPTNNSTIYPYRVDTVAAEFTNPTIVGFSYQPVAIETAERIHVPAYKRTTVRKHKGENPLIVKADRYNIIYNNPIPYSYSATRYPFYRTRIVVNGKSIILNTDNSNSIYAILHLNGALEPSLSVFTGSYNDETDFDVKEITKNNGTFSIKSATLDTYLNRNSSRLIHGAITNGIGIVSNVVGAGASIAAGNPVGAVLGVNNVLTGLMRATQPLAELKDLENYPDQINAATLNAIDDLYLQDDVAIINEEGITWNRSELFEKFKDLHENGVVFPALKDLLVVEHDVFDYVQTSNLILRERMSAEDKHELETAFNNGVRRWHITTSDNDMSERRMNCLREMRTNCMNIPYSII